MQFLSRIKWISRLKEQHNEMSVCAPYICSSMSRKLDVLFSDVVVVCLLICDVFVLVASLSVCNSL